MIFLFRDLGGLQTKSLNLYCVTSRQEVQGRSCLTDFHGMELTRDKICSLIKMLGGSKLEEFEQGSFFIIYLFGGHQTCCKSMVKF